MGVSQGSGLTLASSSHNLRAAPSSVNRLHSAILGGRNAEQRLKRRRGVAAPFTALLVLLASSAHAGEFITEFGGGYKDLPSTSFLLRSNCKKALVTSPEWPENPRGLTHDYSCGGDAPVFVGWPIAYEWDNGVRLGYFHMSQWIDGNGELHMDCLCASWTMRWSRLRRK